MKTRNLYKEISEKIIAQLEKGIIPWHKPWTIRGDESLIVSHSTGKGYSLLNSLLLSEAGEYATFKQIEAEGGHVKKGEITHIHAFEHHELVKYVYRRHKYV